MGRYYTGDIEGKFLFGVQSSDAASRFGGDEVEPNYITYNFETYHLESIESEIKKIKKTLGKKLKIMKDFFAKKEGYNDDDLKKIGISQDDLSEYADLQLGLQIRDCVKKTGGCQFDAEL